uniref:CSON010486 protein n=1 Tax=Culicoides sonorensis TaxID=179676 RepID=A0A336KIT0_CULSO
MCRLEMLVSMSVRYQQSLKLVHVYTCML